MNGTKPFILVFAGALSASAQDAKTGGPAPMRFRSIVRDVPAAGSNEILLDDPSGNAVELFQPTGAYQ